MKPTHKMTEDRNILCRPEKGAAYVIYNGHGMDLYWDRVTCKECLEKKESALAPTR